MPHFFSKYRILICRSLLGLYMLGALQAPVLELLHFLSHSLINHEHGGMHSYADHGDIDAHSTLTVLDNGDEEDRHQQFIIESPDNKIEYFSRTEFSSKILIARHLERKGTSQVPIGTILDIPSPPPKQVYSSLHI